MTAGERTYKLGVNVKSFSCAIIAWTAETILNLEVKIIFLKNIVSAFFDIVNFLILVRILVSFFPINPYGNPFLANVVRFFYQLTEPFLAPFRSLVPPLRVGVGGYLDFSPILALIVLRLLKGLLLGLL